MNSPLPTHASASGLEPAAQDLPARITETEESQILQVVARAHGRDGVIRLLAGESDLPTPAFITEAAVASLHRGETRYTFSQGIPPLRDAIARYHRRIYGVPVGADRINVTVGGMQAISQTLLALLSAGDEVIVPTPTWPNVVEAVRIAAGVPRLVELRADPALGWQLDLADLYAAVGPRTRAIFLNSPANPTGWTMSAQQVADVLAFARARGLWIIADEVYGRMVYDGSVHAPSFLPLIEPEDRVVITNTFSKNWSMTGWRIGWVVAPPSLGPVYDNLMQYGSTGVATFVQHAAIVAIDEGDSHVDAMLERNRVGREIICSMLEQVPRIRLHRPAGAFYLFFALDGLTDSRRFAFDLLDATGVALAPGTAFGAAGQGYMRLCFGVSHGLLRTAAERIAEFARTWR